MGLVAAVCSAVQLAESEVGSGWPGEKKRIKTNLDTHIKHVKESGVTEVIRLLKPWNVRNGLGIKTFVLELLAIKLLEGKSGLRLATQLADVWTTTARRSRSRPTLPGTTYPSPGTGRTTSTTPATTVDTPSSSSRTGTRSSANKMACFIRLQAPAARGKGPETVC